MGGWIDYQVTSPKIPNARNLPATSPGTVRHRLRPVASVGLGNPPRT